MSSLDLAKVYVGNTDISDYVLSVGDFDQVFSNYDGSIRDSDCDITFMSRLITDYPIIALNSNLSIVQDGKKIFIGYLSKFDLDEDKYEIESILSSHVNKMSTIQIFEETILNDILYTLTTMESMTKLGITFRVVNVYQLCKSLFERCTGQDLNIQGFNYLPTQYVAWEMVCNAGCSRISGNWNNRDNENVITCKEFIESFYRYGIFIYWNTTTEKYTATSLKLQTESFNPDLEVPVISDEFIYNRSSEIIVMTRNFKSEVAFSEQYDKYLDIDSWTDLSGRAISNITYNQTLIKSDNDISFNLPNNTCLIDLAVSDWTALSSNYLRLYTARFYVGTCKVVTVETSLYNDFLNSEGYFFRGIHSCRAVYEDGRYFSELEYTKEVT